MKNFSFTQKISETTSSSQRLYASDTLKSKTEYIAAFSSLSPFTNRDTILVSLLQLLQSPHPSVVLNTLNVIDSLTPYLFEIHQSMVSSVRISGNGISPGSLNDSYLSYIKYRIANLKLTFQDLMSTCKNDEVKALNDAESLLRQLGYLCKTANLCYTQAFTEQALVKSILQTLLTDGSVLCGMIDPLLKRMSLTSATTKISKYQNTFKVYCETLKQFYCYNSYMTSRQGNFSGIQFRENTIRRNATQRNLGDEVKPLAAPRYSLQRPPNPSDFEQGNVKRAFENFGAQTNPFN